MIMYDIETLGTQSNAVILSLAAIGFDPEENYSISELINGALFVKFDAAEQIKKYGRKVESGAAEWWSKQPEHAKKKSLIPSKSDLSLDEGMERLEKWLSNSTYFMDGCVWTRGSMDYSVTEDVYINSLKRKNPISYWSMRDVRTAIDILYDTNDGYCSTSIDTSAIVKHDPVHDCALDIAMLVHGE